MIKSVRLADVTAKMSSFDTHITIKCGDDWVIEKTLYDLEESFFKSGDDWEEYFNKLIVKDIKIGNNSILFEVKKQEE